MTEVKLRHRARRVVPLILLSALFVVVCLPSLFWSLPRPIHVHSSVMDEGSPLVMFSKMHPRQLDFNPHYQVSGALGYYIMGAFIGAGGVLHAYPLVTDVNYYRQHIQYLRRIYLAGRLSSLTFGIGIIWLLYGVGAALGDRKAGYLAAALGALTPGIITNSSLMTHNITAGFFTLLAVFFAVRYVRVPSRRGFVFLSVCAGLGVSVKFSAIPALVVIPAALVAVRGFRPVATNVRILAGGVLLSVLAFAVTSPYYIPGLLSSSQGLGGWQSTDVISTATNWEASGGLLGNFLSLPGRLLGILIAQIGLPQILLAALGLILLFPLVRRRKEILPYLSVFVVYIVMLMFTAPYYVEKTRIVPLYPLVILAAAVGLSRLQATLRPLRGAAVSVLVLVFAWQGLLAGSVMAAYRAPEIQRVSDQWMRENVDPESTIGLPYGPLWKYPDRLNYDFTLLEGTHPRETRKTSYRFIVEGDLDSLIAARPDWVILPAAWLSRFEAADRDSSYALVKEFQLDVPRFRGPLALFWNPFLLYDSHLYFLRRRGGLG
jgi:hypothetical protein